MAKDHNLPIHESFDNDPPSLHEDHTTKYPPPPLPPLPPQRPLKFQKQTFLKLFVIPFLTIIFLLVTWMKNITSEYNPQFHIESFRFSSFDIYSSKLSANWKIDFSTKNPSNVTAYFYDNLEASIYLRKKLLAVTMVEPFYQQPRDKTIFRSKFGQSEVTVNDWAARAIFRDQKLHEPLPFEVKVRARVKVDPGKSSERTFLLKFLCSDVSVMLDDSWWKSGLMQGAPKICKDEWLAYKESE